MSPKSVNTRMVLTSLKQDSQFKHCYLSNADKQIYTLDVHRILADDLQLELVVPKGRKNTIQPERTWELTFRDRSGVYQAAIDSISRDEEVLIFTLKPKLSFLARRKNIRFNVDSRNPTTVLFTHGQHQAEGLLVDLSLDGLGIQVNKKTTLSVGDILQKVSFELRSYRVRLTNVPIAHIAYTGRDQRIGLRFETLDPNESDNLKQAFNVWYMSQSASFTGKREG